MFAHKMWLCCAWTNSDLSRFWGNLFAHNGTSSLKGALQAYCCLVLWSEPVYSGYYSPVWSQPIHCLLDLGPFWWLWRSLWSACSALRKEPDIKHRGYHLHPEHFGCSTYTISWWDPDKAQQWSGCWCFSSNSIPCTPTSGIGQQKCGERGFGMGWHPEGNMDGRHWTVWSKSVCVFGWSWSRWSYWRVEMRMGCSWASMCDESCFCTRAEILNLTSSWLGWDNSSWYFWGFWEHGKVHLLHPWSSSTSFIAEISECQHIHLVSGSKAQSVPTQTKHCGHG